MACTKPENMAWDQWNFHLWHLCRNNPRHECCQPVSTPLEDYPPPNEYRPIFQHYGGPSPYYDVLSPYYVGTRLSDIPQYPSPHYISSLFDENRMGNPQKNNIENIKDALDGMNISTKDILQKAIVLRKSGKDLATANILHDVVNLRVTADERETHIENLKEQAVLLEEIGDSTRARMTRNLVTSLG